MCKLFIGADPKLWESSTRSLRIDGMVTSVRLENLFWSALDQIAARDDLNIPQLLTGLYHESLDEGHDLGNFTSFLRVSCLRYFELAAKGFLPLDDALSIGQLPADEILTLEKTERQRHPIRNSAGNAGSQH